MLIVEAAAILCSAPGYPDPSKQSGFDLYTDFFRYGLESVVRFEYFHLILFRYMKKLTVEQLKDGVDKCLDNAWNLGKDSKTLYENGRIPAAYSLLQLSLEEYSKAFIIGWVLLLKLISKEEEANMVLQFLEESQTLVKHKEKLGVSLFAEFIDPQKASQFLKLSKHGDESIDSELILKNIYAETLRSFDQLAHDSRIKDSGFYVGIGKNGFSSPENIISSKVYDDFYKKYRLRAKIIRVNLRKLNTFVIPFYHDMIEAISQASKMAQNEP